MKGLELLYSIKPHYAVDMQLLRIPLVRGCPAAHWPGYANPAQTVSLYCRFIEDPSGTETGDVKAQKLTHKFTLQYVYQTELSLLYYNCQLNIPS